MRYTNCLYFFEKAVADLGLLCMICIADLPCIYDGDGGNVVDNPFPATTIE